MEGKDNFCGGGNALAVVSGEAPDSFHVAPRIENNLDFSMATVPVPALATEGKKKRGRPRKYGPDGKVAAFPLSPMPISSSILLTGEFSAWKGGRGRTVDSIKKSTYKYEVESPGPGERIAYSVGANFTAHVLTVNAGEDVTMKIMSFAQQGSCAICILSANGSISNVTLRQPTSSGGTLTYEGRFEILSLSGSFMPTENGIARSRSGGMSVSLAGPDGRVMGGGLAGLLIAAGPVQVVVGSFLPGHRLEHKNTKQRVEHISTITTTHINPISIDGGIKFSFGGFKPIMTPAAFQEENIISYNNVQDSRNSSADDKEAFPEESNPSQ
ncbi:putative PPC domain-containing protein [Lupinus albus]|uniref:AT-hook motif nuclear-localized protein n=1 Tax=Lupinus albus TaxID=3870 RepID=A0A6A4QEL1_LUPAL|nr:putative PPC domain-containing protein [Lupinus albus]